MQQEIIPFYYEEINLVRTLIDEEGNPWWVAKDVCDILGIANPTQAVDRLDPDERSMLNIGRQGEVNIINEPGLYSLVLSSRKPEAKHFKRWITHEVLPSIRKTGGYRMRPAPADLDSYVPVAREFRAATSIAKMIGLRGNQAVFSANKAVRRLTGHDCLALMGVTHLVAEVQELHLTASDIGKILGGISGREVNRKLEALGIIEETRDYKGRLVWRPTEKGLPFVILKDTGKVHSNGTPILQMFFLESVIALLGGPAHGHC